MDLAGRRESWGSTRRYFFRKMPRFTPLPSFILEAHRLPPLLFLSFRFSCQVRSRRLRKRCSLYHLWAATPMSGCTGFPILNARQARDAVRALNSHMTGDIIVTVMKGNYSRHADDHVHRQGLGEQRL